MNLFHHSRQPFCVLCQCPGEPLAASRLVAMETPPLLPGTGPGTTMLLVHAHPDDETIVTGATMAAAAAAGTRVVLLTCTRGELGEVIPAELAHLEVRPAQLTHDVGHPSGSEASLGAGLARERERELAGALEALGVTDHLWLGRGATAPASGEQTFRDSGMQWGPDGRAMAADTVLPGSFSRAPLPQLAELLAQAVRTLQPGTVITYAADGGYGHPDHVQAHRMTMAALRLAVNPGPGAESVPLPGWQVPNVYAIVSDKPERPLDPGAPRLAVTGDLAAKTAAMRAHRTQLMVDGGRFALSNNQWRDISAVEEYMRLDPYTRSGMDGS